MYISTNIHKIYVCDPLGLYILLVNKLIDPIIPYWLKFINYLHQHIDQLIKDRFNPIHRLSFQATLCTLGDMDYIRTSLWKLIVIGYHVQNPSST